MKKITIEQLVLFAILCAVLLCDLSWLGFGSGVRLSSEEQVRPAVLLEGGDGVTAGKDGIKEVREANGTQKKQEPSQQESIPPAEGRKNLNTATAEELMEVQGIGEKKAADIIAYREEHGPFKSIEEVTAVKGIGDALAAKLQEQFTVK